MRYISYFLKCIIFAGFLSLPILSNAVMPALYKESQLNQFSFPLKLSIEEVVQLLRNDLDMRIHFENERLSEKDAYTAKQVVERYNLQPLESLSQREKHLLSYAKELVNSNEGNMIIDYRKSYINLEPADLSDFSKLIEKIKSTNVYLVRISNGSIIIYPSNVSYENVESFYGDFKSLDNAYGKLEDLLKKRNLNFVIFNNTLPQNDNFKLDVKNEDFRIFLTRFAEAMGSNIVWGISGYEKGRRLSFFSIMQSE